MLHQPRCLEEESSHAFSYCTCSRFGPDPMGRIRPSRPTARGDEPRPIRPACCGGGELTLRRDRHKPYRLHHPGANPRLCDAASRCPGRMRGPVAARGVQPRPIRPACCGGGESTLRRDRHKPHGLHHPGTNPRLCDAASRWPGRMRGPAAGSVAMTPFLRRGRSRACSMRYRSHNSTATRDPD